MARGRVSKYSAAKHPELVFYMAALGMTDKEIAKKLGIDESTLTRWKQKYPDLRTSLKNGKETPDDAVQSALYRRALGYEYEEVISQPDKEGNMVETKRVKKHLAADVTAQIFWLKNRRPEQWRDKREFEGEVFVLKAPEIEKPAETGVSK